MTRLHLAAAAALLAGCTPPAPASRSDQATLAACRTRAEEVYQRQNRAQLSQSGLGGAPYGAVTAPGETDALSARFGHDQLVAACVRDNAP